MLYEFFQHSLTLCPRQIRDMGYLRELIGLRSRYNRCKAEWQPHLRHCQDWISHAIKYCNNRDKVVVLGSGLLLDLPLKELARNFKQVILVDIFHLAPVRKIIRPYDNVDLVTMDITGFSELLYMHVSEGFQLSWPEKANVDVNSSDLVISSNVLSQLWVVPMEFAAKKNIELDREMLAKLLKDHLIVLRKSGGRICLITEIEHRLCKDGKLTEKSDPLFGISIPRVLKKYSMCWDWNFAPHPERHEEYDFVYRVKAYLS